ncbi:hypothetical protein SKAU_G00192530 [Synaphobranchus kaupii]|uniref:Uncharacterized protein n=1 Tax=Synaphobranchus kaupii TaxID=118154 RepID=A0A9Q1FDX4_SYNKA|nr:hypothetical protein SKAU_G00192530 [Synaphobranchus kaupii]
MTSWGDSTVLQVPPVQRQENLAIPDHLLHPTPCPDYGHFMPGRLQLPSHKPTSLHRSAPTTGPEHGCSACVQPPEVLPHHSPAEVTPLAASRGQDQVQSSDTSLHCSQKFRPLLRTGLNPALRSSSTTSLYCCRATSTSFTPWKWLSLTPTAELFHSAPQWWNELPTPLHSSVCFP